MSEKATASAGAGGRDFIRDIVAADLEPGKRQERRHALSARAERLSPYRPRQIDLPQFRHRRRNSAGIAHLRFDDTNPAKEEQEFIDAISATCAGSASTGASIFIYASDYFEQLYEWAEHLIKRRQRLCRRPDAGSRCAANARHFDRAGQRQPLSQSLGRRESRSLPPHARGRIPERRAHAARQDRHGVGQHQSARSGAVSHPARRASAHRQDNGASIRPTISRMASPMRSRASPIRSARSNSRITGRSTIGSSSNLPVPSRPRQYEFARLNIGYTVLSKRVLTQLVRGQARRWLGRSAHADACRAAAARRAAGGDPRLHPPVGVAPRQLASSISQMFDHRRARAPQQDGAAPHGGAAAAQGRDRELRRAGRGARRGQSSRRPGGGHAQHSVRPRDLSSSATISWRTRRRNSSACRPAPRCGCATPISSPAARW